MRSEAFIAGIPSYAARQVGQMFVISAVRICTWHSKVFPHCAVQSTTANIEVAPDAPGTVLPSRSGHNVCHYQWLLSFYSSVQAGSIICRSVCWGFLVRQLHVCLGVAYV